MTATVDTTGDEWHPPPARRLWNRVDSSGGPGTCWPWTGSITRDGYGSFYVNPDLRCRMAHRFAFIFTHGEIPVGFEIDHACRNRRCCNPAHLRLATRQQNNRNSSGRRRGRSAYKGVSWHRGGGKWQASIRANGRSRGLGLFVNEVEAARAYDAAAASLFGEFAFLNFPGRVAA